MASGICACSVSIVSDVKDTLGIHESSAVLLNVMLDSGDDKANPPLGSGTTDTLLGFTYGYESLKWYRWTSIRCRRNGENSGGLRRGDKWLVDFALGYRPTFPVYLKPDNVWILELNGERGQRAELNGSALNSVGANTGGGRSGLSPPASSGHYEILRSRQACNSLLPAT